MLLAGADGAGKTLLRELAIRPELPSVRLLSTVGVEHRILIMERAQFGLELYDVGGDVGAGSSILAVAHGMQALVFVLKASDARLWTALWELTACVRARDNALLPVCVVIAIDGTDAESEAAWPLIARMAAREALPP